MKSAAIAPLLLIAFAAQSVQAKGSGVAIYGIIERVTFDRNGPSPGIIRIKGVFLVPKPMSSGDYQPRQRGYLCFRTAPGREREARRDWKQLRAAAGTGQIVGFADYWTTSPADPSMHYALPVNVRATGDGPPDIYPNSLPDGVTKPDVSAPDYEKTIIAALRNL